MLFPIESSSVIAERLSNIPPDSVSLGIIDIGPVIDAKTLARQNARTATINMTKTVADLLAKLNTLKNLLKLICLIKYINILITMKTIEKPVQVEINVKKSQFICSLFPTQNKRESKEIIQRLNQQYSDATHNCTAYITSDGEGFDDDGEPGGTAGKPMINVLRKNEIHNVTAVVTRYFGGIKLGAGGLVRAYSKSVMEALGEAEIVEIEEYDVYEVVFEYSDIKTVDGEVRNNNLEAIDKEYSDKVIYQVVSRDNRNIEQIFEKYCGKIKVNFKNKQFLKKR